MALSFPWGRGGGVVVKSEPRHFFVTWGAQSVNSFNDRELYGIRREGGGGGGGGGG